LEGAVSRGEITAAYQPQFDLETMEAVAAESLCRWRHPQLGWVSPAEFIPAAEDAGFIGEIGRYMAEDCLGVLTDWPIDVSVNVSPYQLASAAFTGWLVDRLGGLLTQGGRLTLEITETRAVPDIAAVLLRLAPLRSRGVGIALDDFGIGHSSLTQLKRLHASEVKLDRSLVAAGTPEAERKMAEVIEVAHEAGIRVVAEGIETDADLALVRRLGCDRGQGYLLGRPGTRDDLALLLG
jgi:EAL domain-containing protein (putative c-di-GMP-specific phosphodiesterase class I)